MSIAEVSALCVRLVHDTGFAGHYKYTPLHRLVAYLIQLGHNYHYRHLRTHFDWADGSIRRNLTYWTDQVLGILDADDSIDNIRIWNQHDCSDFRRQPYVTRFRNCIGCVDSIFIEIYRPGDRESQSRYFSWYKKMHTLFFTVMCDRTGKIRYCDDGTQPRRQSDQNSIARSRLFLPPGLYLLGDGHYHEDVRCLTPYRYDELRSPHVTNVDRRRMIQYNKSLRSQRILIEWIFSRIRGYFGIFDAKFTYHVSQLPRAFRAACVLYNYISRVRDVWPGVNNRYYDEADNY